MVLELTTEDLETKITAGQRGSVPVLKHAPAISIPFPLFDSFRHGTLSSFCPFFVSISFPFCLPLLLFLFSPPLPLSHIGFLYLLLDESVEHLIGKVSPKPIFRPIQVRKEGAKLRVKEGAGGGRTGVMR